MAKSKVKRENFITIQGWQVTDLGLKGNELIIYACIYGFSQDNQTFSGSLQYLADWTNSTRQGVLKCLKSLVAKGFIAKKDKLINGVKLCEYYATEFTGVQQSLTPVQQSLTGGVKQSLTGGVKQSLTNNIDINNIDNNNINNNNVVYEEIINYLNEKAGTKYRYNNKTTQSHINARLNEHFTVEDFKTVIDKKCAEWKGTEFEQYLRPSTLFGTKFENYLNAKITTKPQPVTQNNDDEFMDLINSIS